MTSAGTLCRYFCHDNNYLNISKFLIIMKNVVMILMLLGGFVITTSQAQNCQPCPPGCCITSCKAPAGSAASAQVMPSTLNIFAAYSPQPTPACTPQQMASCTSQQAAACQGAQNVALKEGKACQPACSGSVSSTSACQPASSVSLTPACQAAPKSSSTSEAAIDQKYHQPAKPKKT